MMARKAGGNTGRAVRGAMARTDKFNQHGLLERAFAFAFHGLVYARIWEDRSSIWTHWRSRPIAAW